ncbi:MAG: IPT/TIG domain-containing protein [Candidatus Altiarchaeota archaeon]|nr:IPT/TIG domain-containing protein [Candidatus Altiarchaeota archaeon]
MESGAIGWTYTGFWHQKTNPQNTCIISDINPALVSLPDDGCLPSAYSGSTMWWYGEDSTGTFIGASYVNYTQSSKNGGHSVTSNSGDLTTPSIDLTASSTALLSFQSWYEIEGVDVDRYDMMSVYVSTDNGASFTLLGSINPLNDVNGESFRPYSSGGLGQVGVWTAQQFDLSNYVGHQVKLKFEFRTVDSLYNGFRGWLVDDVTVISDTGAVTPTIISVTPSMGVMDSIIYVFGTNFLSGATVSIGGVPCSSVSVFSSTEIHAMVPSALSAGTYNVTVTNPGGYSATLPNAFTFTTTQPPSIASITPSSGFNNQTTNVDITGSNFQSGAAVEIASVSLTGVSMVSSSEISAVVPAGLSGGYQNVKVTNPDSQYDVLVGGFYVNATASTTTTSSTTTSTTLPSSTTTVSTTTTSTTVPYSVQITRDLPDAVAAGANFTVTLTMDVNEADPPTSVGLTEYYPSGWTVSGASPSGVDQGDRLEWVFWVLGSPVEDKTITYIVHVPASATGAYDFSGSVDDGTLVEAVAGDTQVTIVEWQPSVNITRDLPDSASSGTSFNVTLTMNVDESNKPGSVGITEYYPSGWTVSNLLSGGLDKGDRIEWVCSSITSCSVVDQEITYTVTIPEGLEGAYGFSGNAYYWGTYLDTTGDTSLTVLAGCEITGDYPPCGVVTLSEVVDLINEWSSGDATLSDVIALINAWAAAA